MGKTMKIKLSLNNYQRIKEMMSIVGAVRLAQIVLTPEGIGLELKRRGYDNAAIEQKTKEILRLIKSRKFTNTL